jgi:integrase
VELSENHDLREGHSQPRAVPNRRNLTDLFIASIKTPGLTWDQKVIGLGIRVGKRRKTWVFAHRTQGSCNPTWRKLGHYPSMGLELARRTAREIELAIDQGKDPDVDSAEGYHSKTDQTFSDLAEQYLEHVKAGMGKRRRIRPRTIKEYERQIDKYLRPAWADRQTASINREDVVKLIQGISAGAPIMGNRVLATISAFFNYGIDVGALQSNPAARLGRLLKSPEEPDGRSLSADDIRRLWQHFSPPLKLLLLTAARHSEVAGPLDGMRWGELSLESATWTIPGSRSKNHRDHVIPLGPQAWALLRSVERNGGRSGRVFPLDIRPAYEGAKERSGIEDWTPHTLRKTAATCMHELGTPPHIVEAILNHSPGKLARTYNRYEFLKEKREALERWDARLAEILGEIPIAPASNVIPFRAHVWEEKAS